MENDGEKMGKDEHGADWVVVGKAANCGSGSSKESSGSDVVRVRRKETRGDTPSLRFQAGP